MPFKLRIAVALLFPMVLHAQDKTRVEKPVPASKRAAYCESHPTDSFNCTAIPATSEDGTHITIGLAKTCPGQPKDVQDKKSNVASWFAMDGIDNEGFEKMGLCKLSDDETTALLQHQWSRVTSRAYYDTDKRQPKKIYVALEPATKENPDIVMSDFRNALRSIPDVELISDEHADFRISVNALQAKIGGNPVGYAIAIELIETYEKPGFNGEKEFLQSLIFQSLSTVATDSLNGDIQDSVAHLNNGNFEKFRSAWPYKTTK